MLASLVAINNPFPFSISGFTGLTTAQIISFFIVFVIFNAYVVLMVIAMVGFYFTSKPKHGKTRTAAIWHFYAVLWMLLAFIGTAGLLFWQLRNQLDHFAVQEIETVEGLLYFAADGNLRLRDEYNSQGVRKIRSR